MTYKLPAGIELARFRPRLLDTWAGYDRARFGRDVAAGVTVGIVALPLAMAFGIASGVTPEQGLITAIVGGFLVSALGGSTVQIGGPAGAFIVIVYGILERHGLTNLLIATALAGVLLFAMGLLRLGGLVRYIPVSIVIGFTNGIAVLIALSQLKDLLGLRIDKMPAGFFAQIQALLAHLQTVNLAALGLGLASLLFLLLWARWTGAQAPLARRRLGVAARLPGPILVLLLGSLGAHLGGLSVETIGSRFGGIPQVLPSLALPPFSWASAQQLLIPILTIALLGAVESLLCARIADNLVDGPRHNPNQELMAQGVANLVVPFFGGLPVTGTIARTVTNARAGASSPVAGLVHALTLLAIVLLAAPLAAHVPLAVLAGVLCFVAWNMGEWREFGRLRHFSLPYRVVLIGTFLLTVVFDLTVGIEVGLLLACGFFIVRMASLFQVTALDRPAPPGVLLLQVYGSLFFGTVDKFEAALMRVPDGCRAVVLHLGRLVSLDSSGLEVLEQAQRQLQRRGIRLVLAEANPQPLALLQRTGFAATLGEAGLADTLDHALARLADPPEPVPAGTAGP